jgi:hypothetical protein
MSLSNIVDEQYRLRVEDLQGRARRVEIANISYQGVEELSPVLHFVGMSRRLVLNERQSQAMIDLTGSPRFADWVGYTIELRPAKVASQPTIALHKVEERRKKALWTNQPAGERAGWIMALLVVLILLTFSALYTMEHAGELWAILEQLFVPR